MATGANVLEMLCPDSKYVIYGDDYDTIVWIAGSPAITKQQFSAGFAQYDAWKAEQEAAAKAAKDSAESKLAALGLTPDDLKALGL
jgi:hypothetical protein